MPPLEKPNNRYILKRFLSSSLPFGLLPLCFLVHLSLLYLLLFSSPPPLFYHSLFLWMSCPQITGVCGGLSETCVEVWRRLMGSPSSSCSPSARARASGEEKLLVSSKTESYWVFLQDIIFHWTDKQEKLPTLCKMQEPVGRLKAPPHHSVQPLLFKILVDVWFSCLLGLNDASRMCLAYYTMRKMTLIQFIKLYIFILDDQG